VKIKAYVRVAKLAGGKPKLAVTTKPSGASLTDSLGNALETVAFAIELDVDDGAFSQARHLVASVKIENPAVLASVSEIAS
jgi:hypothetical protein